MLRTLRTIHFGILLLAGIACSCKPTLVFAQDKVNSDPTLTIDAIFAEQQFKTAPYTGHWQADSQGFELIRKDPTTGTTSIAKIALVSPEAEEVLVPSDLLRPTPTDKPLEIEAYEWSADRSKLLIFTNTRRVWRLNTRGDYWVL